MLVTPRPVFNAFSFEESNNGGKIMPTKLISGFEYAPFTCLTDNTAEVLTVKKDSVVGVIPYLYDFNLD